MIDLKILGSVSQTTEGELRNTFSEKGIVTDVQLKYTKSGKFRHFAFVGYQSNAEAEAAVQYFNQSYFKSLKITVELCTALGKIIVIYFKRIQQAM